MALGEFELIERFFSRPGGERKDVVLGVGDDAAVVRVPPGEELIVAADTLVSGVHFPPDLSPELIGYRALAVNLSDMAAMGATPAWCTLALTLPAAEERWLKGFSEGFLELAASHRVALIGGDTTSGPLTIAVQILGLAPEGSAIRRSGAKVGDAIFVSGFVGDATAGLALLGNKEEGIEKTSLVQRFLKPVPRVELGLALRGLASAAIDISDGLLADLSKLVAASRLGARLELDDLPLSDALLHSVGLDAARRFALNGGDDYELCFTVPPGQIEELQRRAQAAGVSCRRIGTIEKKGSVRCYSGGQLLDVPQAGFDHFRR